MRITIKTKNMELTDSISYYIEKKVQPLAKFLEKIAPNEDDLNPIEERKERIEAFIDVGKESSKGLFFAKAQINVPGKNLLIAKVTSGKLDEAIDSMKDELQRLAVAYKEKPFAVKKRNVKEAKKDIKLTEEARLNKGSRLRQEGL